MNPDQNGSGLRPPSGEEAARPPLLRPNDALRPHAPSRPTAACPVEATAPSLPLPSAAKGRRTPIQWVCLATAGLLLIASLTPPLSTLAAGVLFSAHMLQHLVLLLIVPGLGILSLAPRSASSGSSKLKIAGGWIGGVGSMWFWHAPQLCAAAAAIPTVHWVQVLSLLALGTAFWWPILSPTPADRLNPAAGIAYLFTACLACTALGIILTLAPIEVCPIFRAPTAAYRIFTADEDRQIGGLIMWLPMCLIYLSAIFLELARWLSPKAPAAPITP